MATTTPALASSTYKEQIIDIAAPVSLSVKRTVVIIGDSWAALDEFSGSPLLVSPARGIFRSMNMYMKNYFEIVDVAGTGGETLAQIQTRFATDALALSPAYVAIMGGVNSVTDGQTADQMFATTKLMIDAAIVAGSVPIVFPCQHTEAAFTGSVNAAEDITRNNAATGYNRQLLTYSMQKTGWIYLSKAWDGITDQAFTSANGEYMPAVTAAYSENTGHPNSAGAFRIGKDASAQIINSFVIPDMLPRHDADTASSCWNPMQKVAGTPHTAPALGTGASGTAAQGWYARVQSTGDVVVSQVARTDIAGAYWSKYVVGGVTPLAVGNNLDIRESETTAFSYNYHLLTDHDIAVGDVVEFYAEFKVENMTGSLNNINGNIQMLTAANAGVEVAVMYKNSASNALPYVSADMNGDVLVMSSVRYTISATVAKWYMFFFIDTQTGGSTSTFDFFLGRCGVRKIA